MRSRTHRLIGVICATPLVVLASGALALTRYSLLSFIDTYLLNLPQQTGICALFGTCRSFQYPILPPIWVVTLFLFINTIGTLAVILGFSSRRYISNFSFHQGALSGIYTEKGTQQIAQFEAFVYLSVALLLGFQIVSIWGTGATVLWNTVAEMLQNMHFSGVLLSVDIIPPAFFIYFIATGVSRLVESPDLSAASYPNWQSLVETPRLSLVKEGAVLTFRVEVFILFMMELVLFASAFSRVGF